MSPARGGVRSADPGHAIRCPSYPMVAPRSARHLTWPAARPTFRLQVGAGHADTDNGDGRREAARARIPGHGKCSSLSPNRRRPRTIAAHIRFIRYSPPVPECGWSHTGFRGTVPCEKQCLSMLSYARRGAATFGARRGPGRASPPWLRSVPPAPGRHVGHGVRWAAGRCGLDGTRRRQGGRRGSRCRSAPGRWRQAGIPGYLHGRRAWAWSRGPGTGSLGR